MAFVVEKRWKTDATYPFSNFTSLVVGWRICQWSTFLDTLAGCEVMQWTIEHCTVFAIAPNEWMHIFIKDISFFAASDNLSWSWDYLISGLSGWQLRMCVQSTLCLITIVVMTLSGWLVHRFACPHQLVDSLFAALIGISVAISSCIPSLFFFKRFDDKSSVESQRFLSVECFGQSQWSLIGHSVVWSLSWFSTDTLVSSVAVISAPQRQLLRLIND